MTRNTTTNWSGTVTYRATEVLHPTTLEEAQRAVADHDTVTALGTRHSFNRIADTTGVQICLDQMPQTVVISNDRQTVRVPAAMTYAELGKRLDADGLALANLAGLPHISVAGAIATGTHGSGTRNGSLASSVTGVEIIRADGQVEFVGVDDPRLPAHQVAIGALGVITTVELRVEPAYTVSQAVHLGLPWDALDEHFTAIMSSATSVSLFTDYGPAGIKQVWQKQRTDETASTLDLESIGAARALTPVHPAGGDTDAVSAQDGLPGRWHEVLPHFRADFQPSVGAEIQAEYFVDANDALTAIRQLRTVAEQIAPVLHISEIRAIAQDTAWLSPSFERDTIAFHFTFTADQVGVAVATDAIEEALGAIDYRTHWGKVTATTPAHLLARLPSGPRFAQLQRTLDPAGKFRGGLVADILMV